MSIISKVIRKLKAEGEGALIGYIMCGDPHPKHTPAIAEALIRGGVDVLELGLPFSDPIADGPTIQAASTRALKAGTTAKVVFETAKIIGKEYDVPTVVMTYFNPVFKMGLDKFFEAASSCDVNGVIIPDLPLEEADDYRKAANAASIDTIFLAAPSTTNERLSRIAECSRGFLYLVSHFGVTGVKGAVEESTLRLIRRVKPFMGERLPLAVGFGISQPEHVKCIIDAGADGVIVGSAFVNIVAKNQGNIEVTVQDLSEVAQRLKEATYE